MTKSLKWSCLTLVSLGGALWLINWWAGRPLFLDEANVARNLYDQTITGLLLPLDHKQYAPPLFLMAAKAFGELFGFGERALRLPAMFGGILAVGGLLLAGKRLHLGWWLLLPLALVFLNPEVLRYVGEVKPYCIDLGVAALLLAMALSRKQYNWSTWMAIGALSIWLSLPSVFLLGAVGTGFLVTPVEQVPQKRHRERLIWIFVITGWLVSFAVLYFAVLRPAIGSAYLNNYHDAYFLPLPQSNYPWGQLSSLLLSIPKLTFGFTAIAIFFGAGSLLIGWLKSNWLQRILFTGPLLLVLAASSFGFYSLIPRLMLFILPGLWLMATLGSKHVFETTTLPGYWKYGFVVIWLFVLGGTNVIRHYWHPLTFSDARRLTTQIDEGYKPILHHGVVPTFDYYQRIHPETRQEIAPIAQSADIKDQEFPGKYVLLYDVLTQGNIRESAQRDSIWAVARGCKVRTEAMFRAKAVYLDCSE